MNKLAILPNVTIVAMNGMLNLFHAIDECKTLEEAKPLIIKAVGLVDFVLAQAREAVLEDGPTRH